MRRVFTPVFLSQLPCAGSGISPSGLEEQLIAEIAAGIREEANERLFELPADLPLAPTARSSWVILRTPVL